MNRNILETVIGGIVLFAALFFIYFAYTSSKISSDPTGTTLIARFEKIDGLFAGSEVRMSGVKIGSITKIYLDEKDFLAVATLNVKKTLQIPTDSSAEVQSSGLLGDSYLSIVPGGDVETFKDGDEIINTQSAVNLTDLIGKAIFSKSSSDDNDEEKTEKVDTISPVESEKTDVITGNESSIKNSE